MIQKICDVTKEVIDNDENYVVKKLRTTILAKTGNRISIEVNINVNDDTASCRGHVSRKGLIQMLKQITVDLERTK